MILHNTSPLSVFNKSKKEKQNDAKFSVLGKKYNQQN